MAAVDSSAYTPRLWWLLLAAVTLAGAVPRFWNLNWDQGAYTFHPDEWALNEVVRRIGSDLNPHFFFYGTLPIYLYRATAEVLGLVTGVDWLDRQRLALIGRFYSAVAETAMLPLLFIVGRRLFSAGAGLVAAGLSAGATILIQAAHFGTVDSLLTLAALLLLWLSLRLAADPTPRWYLLAGIVLGMALATKLTAATFIVMPLLAHVLRRKQARSALSTRHWMPGTRHSVLLLGAAAVSCLVFAPYYLLDMPGLWSAIAEQSGELGGSPLLYTLQFTGSTPYLFELRNLVVWSLGLPLGVTALAGWVWSGVRAVSRSAGAVLLTAWPTLYLLLIGTWQARFVRHTLPLVPFCCLFAAGLLFAMYRRVGRWPARALAAIVLLGTTLWGAAFTSIYASPDTRLAATGWIYANVAPGSQIVIENKNDVVPVPGYGGAAGQYKLSVVDPAAPDTAAKMDDFAAKLAGGDLLVVPNRRWSCTLPRLTTYPLTAQYYSLLFNGTLGYTTAATFASPPHLGPLSWPDDAAEETFQVFDHPTVRIFRNTGHLSTEALRRLLGGSP